jgi:hypothetical protein
MTSPHAYTCALYNAETRDEGPPYVGPCDCGATDILERIKSALPQHDEICRETGSSPDCPACLGQLDGRNELLAECAITIEGWRGENERLSIIRPAIIKAETDALRTALLKYGHHLGHCEAMKDGSECTCGFEQARGKE